MPVTSSNNPPAPGEELLIKSNASGNPVNLVLTEHGLAVIKRRRGSVVSGESRSLQLSHSSSSSHSIIPYKQILSATASKGRDGQDQVVVTAVVSKKSQSKSKLWQLSGCPTSSGHVSDVLSKWTSDLMRRSYEILGIQAGRKFLVLLNPIGGQGKALKVWREIVEPIFRAANCTYEVQHTGPRGSPIHATAIAQSIPLDTYSAIVAISGDGIIHELINGLASHASPNRALAIPLIPIPAGSGNALSSNLVGPKRATDFSWAALSAVKGREINLDLCSVTQKDRKFVAFVSVAFGIMADLDLGTEDMRWMGDTRFVVGYIQGSLAKRKYPVELLVKVVESDKKKMAEAYNHSVTSKSSQDQAVLGIDVEIDDRVEERPVITNFAEASKSATRHEGIPERLEPGWHLLKTDVFLVYAGKMPYVAKDVKIFPVAQQDGLIDIAILGPQSRLGALSAMDGMDTGKAFWTPTLRYYKVEAFQMTPLAKKGYISIDGEDTPHETVSVEKHALSAKILALDGWWKAEVPKP